MGWFILTDKNGRVTVAELKKDVSYLRESHNELKCDIKEIKAILMNGEGKIAENRTQIAEINSSISTIKWVFGAIVALLSLAVTVVAAFK